MKDSKKSIVVTGLASIVIAALFASCVGLAIIYSGLINISALVPESPFTEWVLHTTMENSVERHGAAVGTPPRFDDSLVAEGLHHYREMCVTCHGAPGREPSEIGKGLRPSPPDLAKGAKELSDGEIFWIVKNGIRMTGMPSFAGNHSDREIWGITAFVRRLPAISPQEYAALDRQASEHEDDHLHGHDHEHGGHHH